MQIKGGFILAAKIAIGSEEQYKDLLKVIADLRNDQGCV